MNAGMMKPPALKPESYPFLRIAKQFGLDYGVVLRAAEELRQRGRVPDLDHRVVDEIEDATIIQSMIRRGQIDWQTGEHTANFGHSCPTCGSLCDRIEVDIGVGTQVGPWGCANCGWSESPEYDQTRDENRKPDEKGGYKDQFGQYHPAGSATAEGFRMAEETIGAR